MKKKLSGGVKDDGYMVSALNSTFLVLILKVDKPTRFGEFRPISLCNLAYKVIEKLIGIRLKPLLSKVLSLEQFGFLKGRKILDVVGVAQECIHNIKTKKMKALVLKLDLQKAYDCVNWDFLGLILLKSGIGLKTTNWIMSCVITTNFVILVNGGSTSFFKSGHGIRQGFPLSPLLFILVMEGLSLLLKQAHSKGKFSGVKISRIIQIFILLFVDDILIVNKARVSDWEEIAATIYVFCRVTGMVINPFKSSLHHSRMVDQDLIPYKVLFPFNFLSWMQDSAIWVFFSSQ
jgi:hypothetical protein